MAVKEAKSTFSLNGIGTTYDDIFGESEKIKVAEYGRLNPKIGVEMPKDDSFSLAKYAQWGGAVSAVGNALQGVATSYYSGKISKIQNQMAIELAEYNTRQAESSAQSALMQTNYKIGAISEKFERVKSSQKVAMAANGIVLGVGSAAEVTTTTDIDKHRSMEVERLNGIRTAWGIRVQGLSQSLTANNLSASSAATSWGGGFDALNTGASSLAKEYIYTKYGNKSKLAYGSI